MQKEVIFTENHSADEEDTDNSDGKMAVSTDEQEIILRENLSRKDYRNLTPAYGLGIKNIYDIEEYGIDASDITEKGIYYTELVYLDELETLPLTEQQFLIKFSDMMGIDYDEFQNKE